MHERLSAHQVWRTLLMATKNSHHFTITVTNSWLQCQRLCWPHQCLCWHLYQRFPCFCQLLCWHLCLKNSDTCTHASTNTCVDNTLMNAFHQRQCQCLCLCNPCQCLYQCLCQWHSANDDAYTFTNAFAITFTNVFTNASAETLLPKCFCWNASADASADASASAKTLLPMLLLMLLPMPLSLQSPTPLPMFKPTLTDALPMFIPMPTMPGALFYCFIC